MRLALLLGVVVIAAGCSDPISTPPTSMKDPPAETPIIREAVEQVPPPLLVQDLETYEGVVADIVAKLDDVSRAKLRGLKKDDLYLHHHGWGTSIRNRYGLWSDGPLLKRCAARAGRGEFIHPDSASMLIMEGVWEVVNAQQ